MPGGGGPCERLGVTASIEDHGFFMNSSERVKRLLQAVDSPNFKMTLDVGRAFVS